MSGFRAEVEGRTSWGAKARLAKGSEAGMEEEEEEVMM